LKTLDQIFEKNSSLNNVISLAEA